MDRVAWRLQPIRSHRVGHDSMQGLSTHAHPPPPCRALQGSDWTLLAVWRALPSAPLPSFLSHPLPRRAVPTGESSAG